MVPTQISFFYGAISETEAVVSIEYHTNEYSTEEATINKGHLCKFINVTIVEESPKGEMVALKSQDNHKSDGDIGMPQQVWPGLSVHGKGCSWGAR